MKMYDFSKALKNERAKLLAFPEATSKQLLQHLDVNLKMYNPKTVLINAAINDVFNDRANQSPKTFLVILNKWLISVAILV